MGEINAVMKIEKSGDIEVTLTMTLTVSQWKHIADRGHFAPFHDAVTAMVERFSGQVEGEIRP